MCRTLFTVALFKPIVSLDIKVFTVGVKMLPRIVLEVDLFPREPVASAGRGHKAQVGEHMARGGGEHMAQRELSTWLRGVVRAHGSHRGAHGSAKWAMGT